MPLEQADDMSGVLHELKDGIAHWRSALPWPCDFHNSEYKRWAEWNSREIITSETWEKFLCPELQKWKALRGIPGGNKNFFNERFEANQTSINAAWRILRAGCKDIDITGVDISAPQSEVHAFYTAVAKIKDTKNHSPVFASKFCHFMAPNIFPVIDNKAIGLGSQSYETYFAEVHRKWSAINVQVQGELIAELTSRIERCGASLYEKYPFVNKIVELCSIGRRNPTTSTDSS